MAQSRGNLANQTGKYRWNMAAACLRAIRTCACWEFGRMCRIEERFSSSASVSAMMRKYRSAFFRPRTEIVASTCTRKSTNSALGGGNSSGFSARSGTPWIPPVLGEPEMNDGGKLRVAHNVLRSEVSHFGLIARELSSSGQSAESDESGTRQLASGLFVVSVWVAASVISLCAWALMLKGAAYLLGLR